MLKKNQYLGVGMKVIGRGGCIREELEGRIKELSKMKMAGVCYKENKSNNRFCAWALSIKGSKITLRFFTQTIGFVCGLVISLEIQERLRALVCRA